VLTGAVRPLAEAAVKDRAAQQPGASAVRPHDKAPALPFVAVIDAEQVRAAVTVALDASMDAMIEEITGRVLAVLRTKQSEAPAPATAAASTPATAPPVALAPPEPPKPAPPASASPASVQPVRRVTPVRMRSTSVLGLDVGAPEPRDPE
jgi:hypothetical protein